MSRKLKIILVVIAVLVILLLLYTIDKRVISEHDLKSTEEQCADLMRDAYVHCQGVQIGCQILDKEFNVTNSIDNYYLDNSFSPCSEYYDECLDNHLTGDIYYTWIGCQDIITKPNPRKK